ncbi:hypothetical protein ACHAPJ_008025 [Fusarium lateritium]
MVRTCVGLVTIDEHRNVIRLAHYTTQEYFNEHREKWFQGADADIMSACVTSLSFGISTRAVYDYLWHPFFDYSMVYWGDHARECSSLSPEIARILEDERKVHMLSSYLLNDGRFMVHSTPGNHVTRTYTGFSGLHLAAFFGITSVIQDLSDKIDVELKDAWGRTALSYASEGGHRAAVRLLLESCGAEVEAQDSFRRSAILYAARKGHRKIVQDILSSKKNDVAYHEGLFREIKRWRKRDPTRVGEVPRRRWANYSKVKRRWESVQRGCDFLFDAMVQEGVVDISDLDPTGSLPFLPLCLLDPTQITSKRHDVNKAIFNVMDYRSRQLLLKIITKRYLDGVAILTKNDLLTDGEFDQTLELLLGGAVSMNAEATVAALLERGADPNTRCSKHTPLALAAALGYENVISMLLSRGARLDAASNKGQTPLICAVIGGQESIVRRLLEMGANPNARDDSGQTPLVYAVIRGQGGIVRWLLEMGADPNARDDSGQTLLACAVIRGQEGIVRWLLEMGANPNARDDSGKTPLLWAASQGSLLVVQALLESPKIDVGIQDNRGIRPISLATTNLFADVMGPLLEASKLILETKSQGYDQWLLAASWFGQEEVVQSLLDAGRADVNAQNPDGATSLTLAAIRGQEAIVKLLLDTGRVDIHAGRIGSPSAYWYGNRSENKVIRELFREENQRLKLGGTIS